MIDSRVFVVVALLATEGKIVQFVRAALGCVAGRGRSRMSYWKTFRASGSIRIFRRHVLRLLPVLHSKVQPSTEP